MSANIKASTDGTQAIIGVGGVDQMTVSNTGVVTANSFVGLNSSSVTATGSTTARTLANRFADIVNVKDFGAVGDGVADDTTALQAAINTIGVNGGSIFIPKGIFLINSTLNINNKSITISGEATHLTEIRFGSSVVNGFVWYGGTPSTNLSKKIEIKKLTISTNNRSGAGTALTISTDGLGFPGPTALISEIRIRFENNGSDYYGFYEPIGYWTTGILFDKVGEVIVEKSLIVGRNSPGEFGIFELDSGIKITGTADAPVVYSITDTSIGSCDKGVYVVDTSAEGLYFTGCTIGGANYGIYWDTPQDELQIAWSNGHISSRKAAFNLKSLSAFTISNSFFESGFTPGGRKDSWSCLLTDTVSALQLSTFNGNAVFGFGTSTNNWSPFNTITSTGVEITGGGLVNIVGNTFYSLSYGIKIDGLTVGKSSATSNLFHQVTNEYDDGKIGQNFGYKNISRTNGYLDLPNTTRTVFGSEVLTFDALGQCIKILDRPFNGQISSVVCTYHEPQPLGESIYIAINNTTTTQIWFQMTPAPGSTVTRRIGYYAIGQ
jgi:hypothetical protein